MFRISIFEFRIYQSLPIPPHLVPCALKIYRLLCFSLYKKFASCYDSLIKSALQTILEAISKIGFWFKVAAGPSVKPEEYHRYFEDFTRGTNKEIGPKDIFEIASIHLALHIRKFAEYKTNSNSNDR